MLTNKSDQLFKIFDNLLCSISHRFYQKLYTFMEYDKNIVFLSGFLRMIELMKYM